MRDPQEFDAFYRDAGERLLVQTYALTGDLTAARSAVRDSFIVAWHHWRKVSRLDDPESSVRPHAWRHAQRRHTARLWHKESGIGADVKATLDALATLSVTQRKVLLLTQLATVTMPQMAREVGLPLEDAERELQTAASQFALALDIAAADIPIQFEGLAQVTSAVRFPRAPIVRRAGAARRRTHTTVGVVGAVAAFLLTGSLVTDVTGVRPDLDFRVGQTTSSPTSSPTASGSVAATPEVVLDESTLLTEAQVRRSAPSRTWSIRRTGDNSEGSGLLAPCQQARYADPRGTAALVRTFAAAPSGKEPQATVLQLTEESSSPRAARRAYTTALEWYGACLAERVQLLGTRTIGFVGDQAMLMTLRSFDAPVQTMSVGIARTGAYVTTTIANVRDEERPDVDGAAGLLADAVDGLCTLPDGGTCAGAPRPTDADPLPVGAAPAMLSELDLPPVTGVERPWVGTEPRRALTNVAATRCDDASFQGRFEGKPFTNNLTRTFLIPEARLPVRFGITETVASLPRARAEKFVEQIRTRLADCSDKDLGTDVVRVSHVDEAQTDITVWDLTTEISDNESVSYSMAILRNGTSVAQLTFVPDGSATLADGTFGAVAERALQRLARLPRP
ncbi:hypothetical protein NPS01_03440 [Nocardioides psychrotolerans]|uniref:DNA-directed RNA polymerase specialized sigma subunit, sigma24 family n=1 Tax=Nocardioides psychrotolerans TaxID=1005945 RepID=A0A1I3BEK2_9ACTN|nr:hypothetical protein [Nocardioides psychrotolerans]GEP36681.1 hypothetical protein NPS01_03440 [Nocardioides psychrotolerans]SFH60708.1 DNA-directed RNA polymerase specialized sigma subunit, sigma24 family [Nocardioides psychrotolerans]